MSEKVMTKKAAPKEEAEKKEAEKRAPEMTPEMLANFGKKPKKSAMNVRSQVTKKTQKSILPWVRVA